MKPGAKRPCDGDCFKCTFDDCIFDGLDAQAMEQSKELDREARIATEGKIAAQQRAYYEANREKIAAQQRAYREANREKVAAQQRAYREANREKIAAQQRAYREANREKIAAQQRARYRRKKRGDAT